MKAAASSEERSPPLKFILICLLLSSEMVFRIVIKGLFTWFEYGLGHLYFYQGSGPFSIHFSSESNSNKDM